MKSSIASLDWIGLSSIEEPPSPIDQQEAIRSHRDWIACSAPERPFDVHVRLHDCCKSCLIALQASLLHGAPNSGERGIEDVLAYMTARLERFGPAPRSAVTP